MKKQKQDITKDKEFYSIIETIIDNEKIIKIIEENYYQKSMENADNMDVNLNHLENIFTNETYYLAMKIVPLIERKVLYLSFVENEQIIINYLNKVNNPFKLLSVRDVAKDLHIGINQAYDLFKQDDFPTISIGKRKAITLTTYLLWKIGKKGGV